MPDNIGPVKAPLPKPTSSMRAAKPMERVGDFFRDAYHSLAQQPLARVADATGMTNFQGLEDSYSDPNAGNMLAGAKTPAQMAMEAGLKKLVRPASNMIPTELLKKLSGESMLGSNIPKVAEQRFSSNAISPSVANEFNWGSLNPNAGKGMQLVDDVAGVQNNASGSTMASIEALNRGKSMAANKQKFAVRKGGMTRELIGPEAVDYVPQRGEEFGILGPAGFKLLNRGS